MFALLEEIEDRRNCNAKAFDVLYAFESSVIHLVIEFLASCTYFKMWRFLTLNGISRFGGHSENLSQVLLEAHPNVVSDYRVPDFRIIGKL